MVKTRHQKQQRDEELQRLRSIPTSALPPKVCCTPPSSVKRSLSLTSALSTQTETTTAKKKKTLSFAPDPPKEYHFDLKSPPARRILHVNHEGLHDSVVRIEFEARTGEQHPSEIGAKERETFRDWLIRDLKQELKIFHGIDCDHIVEDVAGLQERIELAEALRRRTEIRRTPSFGLIPHEMNLAEIQRELHKRRIAFDNLNHFQASQALERALLKEDAEGLVGEGYQFGRRFVSAADVISFYQPSDKEMRDMLQSRSLKGNMIPRKKSEKLELLSKFVELEQEELMRRLMKDELKRELDRRRIKCDSEDYGDMFESLFATRTWKTNYDDVDIKPFVPTAEEQASGCIIS
jgi:hypothetical protein